MAIEYTNISYEEYNNLYTETVIPYCIEFSNGTKKFMNYYRELHREDGPAIIWEDGTKNWFLNGMQYSFEKFLEKTSITDEEKVFLRLKYGN